MTTVFLRDDIAIPFLLERYMKHVFVVGLVTGDFFPKLYEVPLKKNVSKMTHVTILRLTTKIVNATIIGGYCINFFTVSRSLSMVKLPQCLCLKP